MGNQQNTWVMSGANWVPARQASPVHVNTIGSNICNFREVSAAPYNVKYCENNRLITQEYEQHQAMLIQ